MSKLLFNTNTQQILPYPRQDDQPVVGLDLAFVTLTKVETEPPSYDPETEQLTSSYEVDTQALEYRQVWTVSPKPVAPPEPDWDSFNATLLTDANFAAYQAAVGLPLGPAVLDAYSLVATNGVGAFTLVFNLFCQEAEVTSEHREGWAQAAEACALPQEFVDTIRGE